MLRFIRAMSKNSYIGERALLFDEPRTATVEVTSSEAEPGAHGLGLRV